MDVLHKDYQAIAHYVRERNRRSSDSGDDADDAVVIRDHKTYQIVPNYWDLNKEDAAGFEFKNRRNMVITPDRLRIGSAVFNIERWLTSFEGMLEGWKEATSDGIFSCIK